MGIDPFQPQGRPSPTLCSVLCQQRLICSMTCMASARTILGGEHLCIKVQLSEIATDLYLQQQNSMLMYVPWISLPPGERAPYGDQRLLAHVNPPKLFEKFCELYSSSDSFSPSPPSLTLRWPSGAKYFVQTGSTYELHIPSYSCCTFSSCCPPPSRDNRRKNISWRKTFPRVFRSA